MFYVIFNWTVQGLVDRGKKKNRKKSLTIIQQEGRKVVKFLMARDSEVTRS